MKIQFLCYWSPTNHRQQFLRNTASLKADDVKEIPLEYSKSGHDNLKV